MATTAATQDVSVKQDTVTYSRYVKGTPNAKDATKTDWEAKVFSGMTEAQKEQVAKDGWTLQAEQTVLVQRAGTPDGFAQIIPDDEERVNIFNRGLSQKLSQKITAEFTATKDDGLPEFEFSEGVFNPTELINAPTTRRNLTPTERAVKMLKSSGLSEVQINAMIAAMQSAGQLSDDSAEQEQDAVVAQ